MRWLPLFLLLFAVSAWARSRFRHRFYSSAAAGAIVMALGIFADAALPQLPFHQLVPMPALVLEIGVIALFLAGSYLSAAFRGHFRVYLERPLHRFGFGTWVAGVAVLSVLIRHVLPEWVPAAQWLAVAAAALYLPYLGIALQGYAAMVRHPHRSQANGVILLATVATQAVLLALYHAFPAHIPPLWVLTMALGGGAFYLVGVVFIAQHFHALRSWQLAVEWKNSNCIIHGALSITGLAGADTGCFGPRTLLGIWFAAALLLVLVELLEALRLVERLAERGPRSGALVYDVSQWTRNFTYGMFYAFSLELSRRPGLAARAADLGGWWLIQAVASWGQYPVLALLLIEIGLFFRARLHLGWRRGAPLQRGRKA